MSALSAFLVLPALLAAPAQAAPAPEQQGGHRWVDPRPSTAKLAFELHKLRLFSRGAVQVSPIGRSNEGRPVWSARVGHGPLRILYLTQQHGNEPLGTPAALEFLRETGLGNSPYQRWLRSRVTVDIVVRANPDGHERNWRYNYAPEADPEFGEPGKGYDINRYHNPELAPEDNPATEAGLIQRHYAGFQPDIVVDYHMQGRYRDDAGRELTGSVKWPTHPEVAERAVTLSKQVTVVAAAAMNAAGGNISQYPGGNYQGIARNAYGLRGSGSVLVELSAMPAEHEQAQIRRATHAMLAVARGTANGSLRKIDPEAAERIPPRGEPIGAARTADSA
ncbi:M14 family zinc carboxypeptidase [Amycolatopsis aidingensis]|uniref:M14 family zinc carboxypeptidase n=1 Tax=Amycolatopsis aidingensis TaxID=2842453 RepID=UPI001E29BA33|nr:M14 family zinc carboxypeptidase [Amycolatopsis aidingensis]